jgi:hypothetical protein
MNHIDQPQHVLAARMIRSAGRHATAHRRQRPTAITDAADNCEGVRKSV